MSLYEKAYMYVPESGAVGITDALRAYLTEQTQVNKELNEALRNRIERATSDTATQIAISDLLQVQRADKKLRREHPDVKLHHRFNSAVFSGSLHVPELRMREPEPALLKRRVQLQQEADERDYDRMTGGLIRSARRAKAQAAMSIGAEWRAVNNQLFAVLNCLLAGVGGFAFGYIGLPYLGFDLTQQARLLLGFSFFLIILFIEMYFFTKYVLSLT